MESLSFGTVCQRSIDLTIIMDVTDSDRNDYGDIVQFLNDFLEDFRIDDRMVQVAFILINDQGVNIVFHLDRYSTLRDVSPLYTLEKTAFQNYNGELCTRIRNTIVLR